MAVVEEFTDKLGSKTIVIFSVVFGLLLLNGASDTTGLLLAIVGTALVASYLVGYKLPHTEWDS